MEISKKRIPIVTPSITKIEIDYVTDAIKNAWGKNAYKYIQKFEKEFACYIGVKYALATSSCTGAIHLALLALGIKAGDEVIVPDITWAATIFPLYFVGAKPIFADIDRKSWCIDPKSIRKLITKRTKAIIPVHLYGNPARMDEIIKIAKQNNLYVIEDAAESIGAEFKGKKTGSFGDASVYSFHGTKTLTTGEGGMLLTNNQDLYEKAQYMNDQAKSATKRFWNTGIGHKYRMTDLQASLGLAQLSRLPELLARKERIFNWYKNRLGDVSGIILNEQEEGCKNSYWMVTLIFDKKFGLDKQEVMKNLDQMNIDPRPFFYPLSSMPPFKVKVNNPVSYDISERGINLPCGYDISEKEVNYICDCLLEIFRINYDR